MLNRVILAALLLLAPITKQSSKAVAVDLYSTYNDCLTFEQYMKCTDCNNFSNLNEYPYEVGGNSQNYE